MITKKDIILLNHLRQNARKKITDISRETNIPVTTIYDWLRKNEESIIQKHTTLVDFVKLGYLAKSIILIRSKSTYEIENYMINHPQLNNLYRTNDDYDLLAEMIFKRFEDVDDFKNEVSLRFPSADLFVLNLGKEIIREGYCPKGLA